MENKNNHDNYTISLKMIVEAQQEIEDLLIEYELANMDSFPEANEILSRFKK